MTNGNGEKIGFLRIAIRAFLALSITISLLFISAGRWDYWQGWLYVANTCVILVVALILFSDRGDLARERMKPGPGAKWWDKIFYALYIPGFLAILIVAGLDAGRYGWTAGLPVSVYVLSYTLYFFANYLTLWAMWTNRFFSSVVRIQTERGHQVVQNGPYRFVRHPGYVGGILMMVSASLALGSLRALVPAGLVSMLLIVRTSLEDTTLRNELSGYEDYARTVRYRLMPGIW